MSLHPVRSPPSGPAYAACSATWTRESPQQPTVLVACSGGADSLALLSAAVFEGHKLGARVIGVTVDHGLQEGSAEHASRVVAQMAAMGADETASATVTVEAGGRGVEAAAREARYAVLDQMAEHFGAALVLLGHTRDDQAETVLLGLARGSGGRALAGMRRAFEALPPAAARRQPRRHRHRLPGRGARVLGRPAQRRPGLHPEPGPAPRSCRSWRTSSAPVWPPRSPAPPTSSARTSSCSTRSPRRRTTRCAVDGGLDAVRLAAAAGRAGPPGPPGRPPSTPVRPRRAVPRARPGAGRAARSAAAPRRGPAPRSGDRGPGRGPAHVPARPLWKA